jgi:hypothetical protein
MACSGRADRYREWALPGNRAGKCAPGHKSAFLTVLLAMFWHRNLKVR